MTSLSYFKEFEPLESKLKILARKLMEEPLYLSDEFRSYKMIWKILISNFMEGNLNKFYEMGENFDGIIGFVNIVKNHKADIVFKLWNKELWGKSFVRQVTQLIKLIMNKYNLQRIAIDSADERMVKAAKLCKFKIEGRLKNAFKWEDEMYVLHKMRILKEET